MRRFILSKIFYLLVYIFAVWESDTESHLSILLLKLRRDFVVRISSGRSFQRKAPLKLKLRFR